MNKQDSTYFTNLVSVLGAGVLGFGLGAYFADIFQAYAAWIIIAGIIMHGWGMYQNH